MTPEAFHAITTVGGAWLVAGGIILGGHHPLVAAVSLSVATVFVAVVWL